ncbi:hypothetical protein DIS24_g7226 [Lasiodiplodia hormozganensis]|uniref:Secreted protein n=1 Tax=Lasiodiplodia hormozganensis TaxID=869390 RepID=A0AA39Y8J6_9PEZI|nr:hypothetical protein DIS24_g7226 [Lasiodiplodia hormozganensis]
MKLALVSLAAAFAATPGYSWSLTIWDGDRCDGNSVELSGEGDTDTGCQPYPNGPDGLLSNSFLPKGWGENCRMSLSSQPDCAVAGWGSPIGYPVQLGVVYLEGQCNNLFGINFYEPQTYKYYQYYCPSS